MSYLNEITGLYVLCESKRRVRAALPIQSSVPMETWRSSLLLKLLEIRNNRSYNDSTHNVSADKWNDQLIMYNLNYGN